MDKIAPSKRMSRLIIKSFISHGHFMRKTVHWDISFIFSLTVCVSCHHWSKDVVDREAYSCPLQEISFPRLIVVPLSMSEPDGARNQEQIAASHEFDGVRKEKERLTAASLNKNSHIHITDRYSFSWLLLLV